MDDPTRLLPALPARLARGAVGLIGVLTLTSLVGTALAPLLLVRSPLLLIGLSPDARHVALAVSRVAPWVLITVAVLRRALFSVGMFGLGASYGPAAVTWVEQRSPRFGKILRFLERVFARWGSPILVLVPFASVCLLAGAARTRFLAFLSATTLGHTLWVGSTYYLGTLLSDLTEPVLAFVSEHPLESTLVCIALVLLQQLVARRRALKRRARNYQPDAP
jgi:membrane protein DedA with SNARE-associated domain